MTKTRGPQVEKDRMRYHHPAMPPASDQRIIDVLIDESIFEEPPQVTLAGAVVFEAELAESEDRVRSLYEELSGSYYLDGEKSFETFREDGFHASADLMEVSNHFVRLISQLYGLKLFIEYSTHSRRPDLSIYQTVALLEVRLAELIFRKYRHYDRVRFTIEQNSALDKHYDRIIRCAADRAQYGGEYTVQIGGKTEPHAISIVDYAIVSFGRQLRPGTENHQHRNWRAIRPMVSSVRHLDAGTVELRRGEA